MAYFLANPSLTWIKPEPSMSTEDIMIMIELLKVIKSMQELRYHIDAKNNLEIADKLKHETTWINTNCGAKPFNES